MFPDELVDLRAALEHGQLLLKGLQRGEVLWQDKDDRIRTWWWNYYRNGRVYPTEKVNFF